MLISGEEKSTIKCWELSFMNMLNIKGVDSYVFYSENKRDLDDMSRERREISIKFHFIFKSHVVSVSSSSFTDIFFYLRIFIYTKIKSWLFDSTKKRSEHKRKELKSQIDDVKSLYGGWIMQDLFSEKCKQFTIVYCFWMEHNLWI